MGTQKRRFLLISTHLGFETMGSLNGFLYRKLVVFAYRFCVSASSLFLSLFGVLVRTLFRVKGNEKIGGKRGTEEEEPEVRVTGLKCGREEDGLEKEEEGEEEEGEEGGESPKLFFKFKYQTYREEEIEVTESDPVSSVSTRNYEFFSGKDLSQFVKKPEVVTLSVSELFADSEDGVFENRKISGGGVVSGENAGGSKVGEESVVETEELRVETELESDGDGGGNLEEEYSVKRPVSCEDEVVDVLSDEDASILGDQFLSDIDFLGFESDSDCSPVALGDGFRGFFAASTSDGFLSDRDFEEMSSRYEAEDFGVEDEDILEELKRMEESKMDDSAKLGSEDSLHEDGKVYKSSSLQPKEKLADTKAEKSDSHDVSDWTDEDSSGLESLWEQQDFLEQLKMDLKKVRATGLPTISEEDEYPKIVEDFKPWKLDDKFHRVDKMSELHKFYRSYKERMRKLDILNYQKRIAMGCLQSKDPLQSIPSQKDSAPPLVSLISSKFLLCRRKISASDPTMNIMEELQSEFETVYVGQMCLSWEILNWQYEKALQLWDSDHYGIRRYNEVAGEFQQFQVLLQRFVENEQFDGPRVENYTNKRYVLRNLLQVPVIREDSSKDKKARIKGPDDSAITSERLIEIMEETIRIYWRFVRADKDAHHATQKGRHRPQLESEDPTELELWTDVRTSLQKKERKLKEARSGSGILRRFQKRNEDDSDHVLYFFSQVDMRLVSRVLNMSKITTDQLLWCRNKLSRINFVGRKIHVEQSFCLFPC